MSLKTFSTSWLTKLIGTTEVQTVTKTKWQQKYLAGNTSSAGILTALTFNNLTIGKTYRVGLHVDFQGTGAKRIDIYNGATQLTRLEMSGGSSELNTFTSKIFVATATTVTFDFAVASSQLQGSDLTSTSAILEELPNHELTTQWT